MSESRLDEPRYAWYGVGGVAFLRFYWITGLDVVGTLVFSLLNLYEMVIWDDF